MNFKKIFLLLPLVFLVFSSAHAASYNKVFKKYTRSDKVYNKDDLGTKIEWSATYITPELITAQGKLLQKKMKTSSIQRLNYEEEMIRNQKNEMLFFVSFYTADRKHEDLTVPANDSFLILKVGGQEYRPSKIERIKTPSPTEAVLYPTLNTWTTGYYVWFDAFHDESQPLSLGVHSPFATSIIQWN